MNMQLREADFFFRCDFFTMKYDKEQLRSEDRKKRRRLATGTSIGSGRDQLPLSGEEKQNNRQISWRLSFPSAFQYHTLSSSSFLYSYFSSPSSSFSSSSLPSSPSSSLSFSFFISSFSFSFSSFSFSFCFFFFFFFSYLFSLIFFLFFSFFLFFFFFFFFFFRMLSFREVRLGFSR